MESKTVKLSKLQRAASLSRGFGMMFVWIGLAGGIWFNPLWFVVAGLAIILFLASFIFVRMDRANEGVGAGE